MKVSDAVFYAKRHIVITMLSLAASCSLLQGQESSDEFTIIKTGKRFQLKNNPGPLEISDRGIVPTNPVDFAAKLSQCVAGRYRPQTNNEESESGIEVEANESYIEIKRLSNSQITVIVNLKVSAIQQRGTRKERIAWSKTDKYNLDLSDIEKNDFHIRKNFIARQDGGYVTEKSTGFVSIEGMLGDSRSVTFVRSIYLRTSGRFSEGDEEQKRYYLTIKNSEDGDWIILVTLTKGTSRLDTFDFACELD